MLVCPWLIPTLRRNNNLINVVKFLEGWIKKHNPTPSPSLEGLEVGLPENPFIE